MRLVDDQRVIGFQQRVGLCFSEQDAVGHQLDRAVAAQAVLKPDLEAHHFAERRFEFFGNAFGHAAGGNPARLRVTNELALTRRIVQFAASHGQRNLGQLGGLAGAGLAANNDDLVLA